MSKRW